MWGVRLGWGDGVDYDFAPFEGGEALLGDSEEDKKGETWAEKTQKIFNLMPFLQSEI